MQPKTKRLTILSGAAVATAFIGYGGGLLAQLAPQLKAPPSAAAPGGVVAGAVPASLAARNEQRRQQRETTLRSFMAARGFEDKAVQDAVAAHLQEQDEQRRAVLMAGRKLLPMLGGKNAAPKDEQVEAAVTEYQKALSAYFERRKKASADLDEAVKFSQKPRLKLLLLALGAIDNGPPILPL